MKRKKSIGLIIAGGKGKRLAPLTNSSPKCLIDFAFNYKVIDFTLSNCYFSQLTKVGIITSKNFQPFLEYAKEWEKQNNIHNFITILPTKNQDEYLGSADAFLQNLEWIKQEDPDYLFIFLDDHIYQMNYETLLKFHTDKKAEISIITKKMKGIDAQRFGTLKLNEDKRVIAYEQIDNFNADYIIATGIAIFNWKKLCATLIKTKKHFIDFGKDLMPYLFQEKKLKYYAYEYLEYWQDIGIMNAFVSAYKLFLKDPWWNFELFPLLTANKITKYKFINDKKHQNSFISDNSKVFSETKNCYIGNNALVKLKNKLENCIIFNNVILEKEINDNKNMLIFCNELFNEQKNNNLEIIKIIDDK